MADTSGQDAESFYAIVSITHLMSMIYEIYRGA